MHNDSFVLKQVFGNKKYNVHMDHGLFFSNLRYFSCKNFHNVKIVLTLRDSRDLRISDTNKQTCALFLFCCRSYRLLASKKTHYAA